MILNGVEIEDTFAEAFPMYYGRVVITAATRRWALAAALEAKGLGTSSTMKPRAPGEAGIECEMKNVDTPDGRPGYVLIVGEMKKEEIAYYLITRIRKGAFPVPTTSAFDVMPKEMVVDKIYVKGTPLQTFGDGFEEIVDLYGRSLYKVPRMDGFFYVDTQLGITRGVAGGNLLIMGESQAAALLASETAVNAIEEVPFAFVVGAYGAGPAGSGTKVGGLVYKDATATLNHVYCPPIANKAKDSKVPQGVNCIYEVCIDGLNLAAVKTAMKVGIKAAVKIEGVKKITSANFGGNLGTTMINLRDVLP
ncbi:MAG: formylmethanofuran--tetrahydromethanopterin N-formyltransferase [Candidatus Bathyarchaeia archaeon]|jgi:formylmethanofuran--tetrahydromethanopterin N-formyltransferase